MKALILAAGKGTRLKELTSDCPKPMLPVGEEPLLAHHLRRLRNAGVSKVAINLHHAPKVITGYFGDGHQFGVAITYLYENELSGTAGAAKKLQDFLDETFFVIYGDVFSNVNLSALVRFHAARKGSGMAETALTLSLYRVPNPSECGLVEIDDDGRVWRFVEKPPFDQVFTDLANAGILICEPEILDLIPQSVPFDFGRDLIPELLAKGIGVFGCPIGSDEFLVDIGTSAGYRRAQLLATTQPVG